MISVVSIVLGYVGCSALWHFVFRDKSRSRRKRREARLSAGHTAAQWVSAERASAAVAVAGFAAALRTNRRSISATLC